MCGMSNSRRVHILAYSKLGLIVVFSLLFIAGITVLSIYYNEIEKRMGGIKEFLITAIIGFILTMVFETALLVLLFKGIKQHSYKKCHIWFIINAIVFGVSFVSFLFEAFAAWPISLFATLAELIYDGCALKIVYDFMEEVRTTPEGDVPFQEMKNETV